jgi:hypothetical protein
MHVRKGALSDPTNTSNERRVSRRRRIVLAAGIVAPLIVSAAACSTSSEGGTPNCESNGPNGDAGVPGKPHDDAGAPGKDSGHAGPDAGGPITHDGATKDAAAGATFRPSNLPNGAIELGDAEVIGDAVINHDCFLDTSDGTLACSGTIDHFDYAFKMIDQPDGGQVGLFVVKSLRVAQAAQLRVIGGSPAVVYALDTIKIDGLVTGVASDQPAGGFEQEQTGHGGGPGGGDGLLNYNAAGGGSYCGVGGKGGPGSGGPANAGGKTYGNPQIVPLIAGSSGGGGSGATLSTSGGTGGAGLELIAGRSISISLGGVINVGGRGGDANGGAGGSGGAIILEAPTVTVRGTLAANGGGGALFNGGSSGQTGLPSATAAQGSAQTAGIGSAGKTANGGDGSTEAGSANSAGGGGGGAGRIRINTESGSADITGATISPDPSTGCATQGKLAS